MEGRRNCFLLAKGMNQEVCYILILKVTYISRKIFLRTILYYYKIIYCTYYVYRHSESKKIFRSGLFSLDRKTGI